MIILGINAFHGDSAAALVRDGVLLAAAEEERFRRVKHWAGFPTQSIAYCLREAGARLGSGRPGAAHAAGGPCRGPSPSPRSDPRSIAQPSPPDAHSRPPRGGLSGRA